MYGKAKVIDLAGAVNACVVRVPCALDGRDVFFPICSKQWYGLCHLIAAIYLRNDLQQLVQLNKPCDHSSDSIVALWRYIRRTEVISPLPPFLIKGSGIGGQLSLDLGVHLDIAIETLLAEAGVRHALNPSEVARCTPRL